MKDRPFLISGILGLGAVVMTLVLSAVGPRPTAPLPAEAATRLMEKLLAVPSSKEVTLLSDDGSSQPEAACGTAAKAREHLSHSSDTVRNVQLNDGALPASPPKMP